MTDAEAGGAGGARGRTAAAEAVRARTIEAFWRRALAQEGARRIRVWEILADAGASRSSFYSLFGSMEGLVAQCGEGLLEELAEAVRREPLGLTAQESLGYAVAGLGPDFPRKAALAAGSGACPGLLGRMASAATEGLSLRFPGSDAVAEVALALALGAGGTGGSGPVGAEDAGTARAVARHMKTYKFDTVTYKLGMRPWFRRRARCQRPPAGGSWTPSGRTRWSTGGSGRSPSGRS